MVKCVLEHLYLATGKSSEIEALREDLPVSFNVIEIDDWIDSDSVQLDVLDLFCKKLNIEMDVHVNLVLFIGQDFETATPKMLFFVGAFMILHLGQTADSVSSLLEACGIMTPGSPPSISSQGRHLSIYHYWRALDKVLSLGWLVRSSSEEEPALDMEEFAHYAAAANGGLRLAAPGELIFFPAPADLPDGVDWHDYSPASGRVARRFSARFYARLLPDLGVSCVACLGRGAPAAAAAFEARGLAAADLGLAADGSSLLRGLDRLLSLARAAPGAVAVHSGDAGGGWPGYAGTLAAAVLISRLGFDEGTAAAWLEIAGPWAPARHPGPPPPTVTPQLSLPPVHG